MKICYLFILCFSIIFPQSSSLSLYGFGERIYSLDASSVGIGNSRLFTSNSNNFTLSSPSTYHYNNQANLSISMSVNKASSDKISKLLSNNFNHLSFGFPITDNQYFMLSMNPRFRSNINLREDFRFIGANDSNYDHDGDAEDDALRHHNIYEFSGGISEISTSVSSRITDNISLGFRIGKLFGTSKMQDTLFIYPAEIDMNDGEWELIEDDWLTYQMSENKYNYSSFTYSLDMRFKIFEKDILAFYFGQSDYLRVKRNHEDNDLIRYKTKGYKDYGIGFKCNIYDNFGYIVEFQKYDSFGSIDAVNIFHNAPLDMTSYNVGMFIKYNNISHPNINSINLNLGFYDKLFKMGNESISSDLALTLGLGIEYLNNNSFTLSLEAGNRNSEFSEFKNERYYKFIFSFISNSMWFIKEGI